MPNKIKFPHLTPKPIASVVPDFSEGVCTLPRGIKTAQEGMTQEASLRAIKARTRAKALCNAGPCPIRKMCREWVLSQEEPRGSWGGVYGGLDPWNRRGLELIICGGKAREIPYDIDES